ncbi:hypothetical protein [Halegenticoccus tardaugens]|uniref:hypothetical protein n=1 Tax=Halegenticoccus tardaugens TaxID=2071624 RepID=UPI00100BF760|nr:hypothetical protein [Halegenticoccus tardaugens]
MSSNTSFDKTRSSNVLCSRRRILRSGAGAVTAAIALPAIGGVAAAHFPEELDIDVRPRCDRNVIPAEGQPVVPVAIHYTEYTDENGETVVFDPTERAKRYRFGAPDTVEDGGGARPTDHIHVIDVDDDGNDDLVLRFPIAETRFDGEETTAMLVWERDETGEHGLSGTDEIDFAGSERQR